MRLVKVDTGIQDTIQFMLRRLAQYSYYPTRRKGMLSSWEKE